MQHAIKYEDAGFGEMSRLALDTALFMQHESRMDSYMYLERNSIFHLDDKRNRTSFISTVRSAALRKYLSLTAMRTLDVEVN